jgi:hypothetical protein
MASHKRPTIGAIFLRVLIFSTCIVIMAYGAVTPHELYKVAAECATIGITGFAMFVQVFVTFSACRCLPFNIWVTIGLDGLCAAGWCAAIALLSYWDLDVSYTPHGNDPSAWFDCADARYWETVLTDDGFGKWINLVWCQVEVDGKSRLVGNGAAREQLHVLIGMSAVSLFFTGLILWWTIHQGRQLALIKPRRYAAAA